MLATPAFKVGNISLRVKELSGVDKQAGVRQTEAPSGRHVAAVAVDGIAIIVGEDDFRKLMRVGGVLCNQKQGEIVIIIGMLALDIQHTHSYINIHI